MLKLKKSDSGGPAKKNENSFTYRYAPPESRLVKPGLPAG